MIRRTLKRLWRRFDCSPRRRPDLLDHAEIAVYLAAGMLIVLLLFMIADTAAH